jgi:putative NIF3 family GTP cyclohydrolase 1 type 2
MTTQINRRSFCKVAAATTAMRLLGTAVPLHAQAGTLTVRDVMARMAQHVGVKPRYPNADTIKIGSPDERVTGITTTFMSTLDLLQRSRAAGNNFVVSHEPTFWSSSDVVSDLRDDALYREKVEFCQKNHMVIMRYHDAWHAHKPDGIFTGFNQWTGWDKYLSQFPGEARGNYYALPATTAGEVVKHLAKTINQKSIRLVGDPSTPVSKAGFVGHYIAQCMVVAPKVDLVIAGESREWECAEYMRDAVALGKKKAYIQLSHEGMEEAGMDNCAKWMSEFITEVPVKFIPSGDPFWIA